MADEDKRIAKRGTDTALMPPPPSKRIKRPAKVLDENVYASALSHIIARDYFPGLLESEAQVEYLSAVKSEDKAWIMEAGRKMVDVMTPGPHGRRRGISFTPRGRPDETPLYTPRGTVRSTPRSVSDDFREERTPDVDVNMSLSAFQSRYTSEDNESFNELLDKQNSRRSNKYAHFYQGNKIPTARQIAYRKELAAQPERSHIVRNSQGEERRLLSAARPSQDLDDRPAQLQSFPDRQGPRNNFMFEPDGVEDTLTTAAQEADAKSMAAPRQTNYSGTRFREAPAFDIMPASPSMSAVDAAIAGQPRLSGSSVNYSGAETPRVNGYAFVDAEPPPEVGMPVSDEHAVQAEKAVFDQLLPKVDRNPNPFGIKTQSRREDIHARLVEKADASRRRAPTSDSLKRLGITPQGTASPQTRADKRVQMTPAARQLAARLATPRRGW